MVMANDIHDKNDAKADALRRCKTDRNLARIAYYRINDAGDFKMLYSHKNENAPPAPGEEPEAAPAKKKKRKKPRKKTRWEKIKALFGA